MMTVSSLIKSNRLRRLGEGI